MSDGVNASGPEHLAPKPAPGLQFDARGVLVPVAGQMFERHRFKTDPTDYRPVKFPPPGPYWCTGYSCNPNDESLSTEHAIVVAYLPKGEPLQNWWPDACDVETEEQPKITFSSRFPRPDWW